MAAKDNPIKRSSALGKGLNSLLGDVDAVESNEQPSDIIIKLDPKSITPNPHQPRKVFRKEQLADLARSLKEDGVIQPLLVSKGDKPGQYLLIAGERRWRASQIAGLEKVPAIVKEVTSDDLLRIALIENIQRADLNVIEEAEAFASLMNDFGLTQAQCAEKVGKERATVANTLRLLMLPREVQDDLMDQRLSMGHGRALLSLEDKKLMLKARDIIISKKLSVRQSEQLCRRLKKNPDGAGPHAGASANPDLEYLAETLRSHLRTKVKLSGSGSKGRIEISYFSAPELERILDQLGVS